MRRVCEFAGARPPSTTSQRALLLVFLVGPADNALLRTYYERAGFRQIRDVALPPAAALGSPPGTLLSRYERILTICPNSPDAEIIAAPFAERSTAEACQP
jgi:hypothetical protein